LSASLNVQADQSEYRSTKLHSVKQAGFRSAKRETVTFGARFATSSVVLWSKNAENFEFSDM